MTPLTVLLIENTMISLCYYTIGILVAISLWRVRERGVNALGLSTAGIFFTCALGHSFHTVSYILASAAPALAATSEFICPLVGNVGQHGAAPWQQIVIDGATLIPAMGFLALRGRYGLLAKGEGIVLDYERALARHRYERSAIASALTDALVVCDRAGMVREANPALTHLTGIPNDQIVGRPLAAMLAAPESAERLMRAAHQPIPALEVSLRCASGCPVPVTWSAGPIRDEQGATEGFVAIAHDIRSQKATAHQLETLVAERTAQLEQALSEQSHLLETVSALSTPIIPVLDGVLVLPIVGVVDARRAQRITAELLERIQSQRARMVIIDVTGLPVVDDAVVTSLLRCAQSARLLGTETILSGIRPEVAQTIVAQGLDLSSIRSAQTLADATRMTMRQAIARS